MLKYTLLIYFIVYLATTFVWRSYLVWKRSGVNPFVLGNGDNPYDFVGKVFKGVIGLTAVTIVIYTFSDTLYQFFAPMTWLKSSILTTFGLVLLVVSWLFILIAQAHMGKSWRIGIDRHVKTDLVQTGIYRYSRNPIFLGMIFTSLGLFLVMPNAITLLIWVLGTILIHVQVRLEEEFLTQVHGEHYHTYKQQVRRWL